MPHRAASYSAGCTTDYGQLGTSGLTVSAVGLGCNNLGRPGTPTESQRGTNTVIHAAIEEGITLFDVADTYGKTPGLSEEMLRTAPARNRDDIIVDAKFGMDMQGANGTDWGRRGSRRYIMRAVVCPGGATGERRRTSGG
ncbi:aldo/keto reductase [Paenarthrobacter sp. Z7-10]|nr:aldo/keto reductase [Paenarthrobacter sp. Z7-10]